MNQINQYVFFLESDGGPEKSPLRPHRAVMAAHDIQPMAINIHELSLSILSNTTRLAPFPFINTEIYT